MYFWAVTKIFIFKLNTNKCILLYQVSNNLRSSRALAVHERCVEQMLTQIKIIIRLEIPLYKQLHTILIRLFMLLIFLVLALLHLLFLHSLTIIYYYQLRTL